MKRFVCILLFICLVTVTANAQTVMNFDKELSDIDSDVVIQPPPGKTWTLLRGSFVMRRGIQSAGLTVYEQVGEEPGLCTNLIRADLSEHVWIPIIGGFVAHPYFGYLKGQEEPIVLPYPNRLVIHVEGFTQPTDTWTRFTILETDSQ